MKKNIRDDFEGMYLRSNIVRRDIGNADPEVLKSTDFNKICAYMAGRCFTKNRQTLLSRGFEYDDVLSIAKVFGATYVGANYTHEDKSVATARNLMMRYIGHRLNTMVRWVIKKMKDDEILDRRVMPSSDTPDETVDSFTLADEVAVMQDSYDEEARPKVKRRLKIKLKDKKRQLAETRREQIDLTKILKKKLQLNYGSMSDILAYYSTTKSVSYDMRKVARKYCDKYGIDYRVVAEEMIKKHSYDRMEFDL